MEPDELESVIRLWHATSVDTYGFIAAESARTLEDRRGYFTANIAAGCALWVADIDGAIEGFMALRESYIDRLYVHPQSQRAGIGTALLARARELHPAGLELHTHQENTKACAFYEKHGFKPIRFGMSPPPENEPDVEYHWRP